MIFTALLHDTLPPTLIPFAAVYVIGVHSVRLKFSIISSSTYTKIYKLSEKRGRVKFRQSTTTNYELFLLPGDAVHYCRVLCPSRILLPLSDWFLPFSFIHLRIRIFLLRDWWWLLREVIWLLPAFQSGADSSPCLGHDLLDLPSIGRYRRVHPQSHVLWLPR